MAVGRGSAKPCMVVVAATLCLIALTKPALGATHTVGENSGWTFNVENWPSGKSFQVGDTLEFNYDKTIHNVVEVDKKGYESCSSPKGSKVHQSGKDTMKLKSGNNYFICSIPGHCQSGMKIDVAAA